MTECKNYRGFNLLILVGEIYTGVLIGRVRIVTEYVTDDEKGDQGWGL